MNNKKIHYKQFAEVNGVDFFEIYNRRLRGESWKKLADGKCNQGTMMSLTQEWCKDNGMDFEILKNGNGILSDPNMVDKGRVMALRKARWSIENIAVDCHCTTECVEQILYGDGNEDNTEELRKYYNDTRL